MTLVSCPECGKPVSDGAERCPQCGAPMISLKRTAATAWRHGLSHAWKAAASFPLLFVLIQLLRGAEPSRVLSLEQLPWIALIAVWGGIASMTAIGVSAVLRRLFKGSREEDLWGWADEAVAAVILFFGLWLTTIPLNPM